MPDIHVLTDTVVLPLWVVGGLIVLAIVLAVIAFARGPAFGPVVQAVVVLLALGFAGIYLERLDADARLQQRRAIEARLSALTAQALAPRSPLACLDNAAGDVVVEACEKTVFASPEQTAAAVGYVAARLDLLREIAALPDREKAAYETMLAPLVRGIESDRFGLVAHVLQTRDACSAESCDIFEIVQHRDLLAENLRSGAYTARLARHAPGWGETPPLAAAQQPAAPYNPVNINFPTAASIPPVSIMNNEPGMAGQNGMEPAAKPEPRQESRAQVPAPQRRPAPKAAPRPQQTTGAPVQITPQ